MKTTNKLSFSIPEKLAFVKMIHSIIVADRVIHKKEIQFLTELSHRLNFELSFVQQAKTMDLYQSQAILDKMEKSKKETVIQVLQEMARIDGIIADQEMSILLDLFNHLSISLESNEE
ncbi:hypothetical protein [Maribacter sp. 2308TA10-17]|uniref:tellurite resistance TerB family protein n=1 Tax=Maribacter sp. 2308TA10-17 TaxID=3386276 RepID=UPI0039BC400F